MRSFQHYNVIFFCFLIKKLLTIGDDRFVELNFSIPWPSGIQVDKVSIDDNHHHRIGRLQHSSVSIRPHWRIIHLLENVLNSEECLGLLTDAIQYSRWNQGRHIDYYIRPTSDISIDKLVS